VFGVWRTTVLRWLKQWVDSLPTLLETLLPVQAHDVFELDELVSFVREKWFKRWLWSANCRRARQIVAYTIGDRSETTTRKLWQAIPDAYRSCPILHESLQCFPLIVPSQHHPVPKGMGLTNHQERWYNTPCDSGTVVTLVSHTLFPSRISTTP